MGFLFIICLYYCTTLVLAQQGLIGDECIHVGNKTEGKCQSPGYPNKCEPGKYCCDFQVEEGYKIEVIVDKLKINGATEDYMTIKPNNHEGFLFTWMLKEKKTYLIEGNYVRIESELKGADKACSGFSVRFKRYGEKPPKPVSTTTEPNWPTPHDNDTIYHTVFVEHVTSEQFKKRQHEFRKLMANISIDYCRLNKIPVAENITELNVHIKLAIECPLQWPNSDTCMEIRYAIPIFLKQGTKFGYQLSSDHLRTMWNEFGKEKIKIFGWTEYKIPDNYHAMLIWILLSVAVIAIFFTVLFYIKCFGYRFLSIFRNRKPSDMEEIITSKTRISDASLWPMSGQVVPPLFGNENACFYYEPDSAPVSLNNTNHNQIYNKFSNKIISVDDSSDDEILNIVNISQKTVILPVDKNNESVL